jgi:transcriptional regulator with XRE-family HTH domain
VKLSQRFETGFAKKPERKRRQGELIMSTMAHWTARSVDDYVYGISAGFTAQIEAKMEAEGVSRTELARRLKKSTGRVSQVLNDPGNLSLKSTVEYAKALGMEVSVVAYDGAASSNNGPVRPDVFVKCWEYANRPADLFEAAAGKSSSSKPFGQIAAYATGTCVDAGRLGGVDCYVCAPTVPTIPVGLIGHYVLASGLVVSDPPSEIWAGEIITSPPISQPEGRGKWTAQDLQFRGKGRRAA